MVWHVTLFPGHVLSFSMLHGIEKISDTGGEVTSTCTCMCVIKSIYHLPTEGLVPSWVLGAINIGGCLVDGVANTYPAVGVHAGPTIVLSQLSLHEQRKIVFLCTHVGHRE